MGGTDVGGSRTDGIAVVSEERVGGTDMTGSYCGRNRCDWVERSGTAGTGVVAEGRSG